MGVKRTELDGLIKIGEWEITNESELSPNANFVGTRFSTTCVIVVDVFFLHSCHSRIEE